MPKEPVISVILPFFNAESTLQRAAESILNQDFEDFELILVNNNSTDGSPSLAEKLSALDRRILLLDEAKRSVVFASNTGATLARGKYLARMDADDESLPHRLSLQKELLESNPGVGAVAGRVEHIAYSEGKEGIERFVHWSNSLLTHEQMYLQRFVEFPLVNPTLMWRKEVGEKLGLYRAGDFPEDYEMILRWFKAGVRIEKIDHPLLKWVDSAGRLTRTHNAYRKSAFYRLKTRYLAEWLSENNPWQPEVVIWGASRLSKKRAALLEENGQRIKAYIDIKRTRQTDKELIYYEDLPVAGSMFILVYIGHEAMKERTEEFLLKKGYREGRDFLFVS